METDEKDNKIEYEQLRELETKENQERQEYEQRNVVEAQQNQDARDAGLLKDNAEGKQENDAKGNKDAFDVIPDRANYDERNAIEAQQNQEARGESSFSKVEPIVADYIEMLNLTEDQKNEMLANVMKEADRNPDLGEMFKRAQSDIYHENTQTMLKFEVQEGETPNQAFDRKLEEIGFHKGEHENTPLEFLDGGKEGHYYQRFKDVEGSLQEHIRFDEPVENADGSYSVTIVGESHRNSDMETVYGEGAFGDLEPSRNSIEHLINWSYWGKNSAVEWTKDKITSFFGEH